MFDVSHCFLLPYSPFRKLKQVKQRLEDLTSIVSEYEVTSSFIIFKPLSMHSNVTSVYQVIRCFYDFDGVAFTMCLFYRYCLVDCCQEVSNVIPGPLWS